VAYFRKIENSQNFKKSGKNYQGNYLQLKRNSGGGKFDVDFMKGKKNQESTKDIRKM
jgi:hypothetical protein